MGGSDWQSLNLSVDASVSSCNSRPKLGYYNRIYGVGDVAVENNTGCFWRVARRSGA
jgi:hypothetical protein